MLHFAEEKRLCLGHFLIESFGSRSRVKVNEFAEVASRRPRRRLPE